MQPFMLIGLIVFVTIARPSPGDDNPDQHSTNGLTSLHDIQIVCVDPDATGYATFQSHNQKVVSNRNGIFMTYIRTRNNEYTAQCWRLLRSTDGGRSFGVIYEATNATNPPVIETDEDANLYLIRVDFMDGNAYLYRFLASDEYQQPHITTIPGGAAGKYAMAIDLRRERLYFFSHNNSFHILKLDGEVLHSTVLLREGPHAVLQYPHLYLDLDGNLSAAWTTQKHNVYLYWDIHTMLSRDGGWSWSTLTGDVLTPPIVADDTGPAMRITLDDEFEAHTWLSNMIVKNGKIHFLYLAQTQPPRQHYMRYDLAGGTREIDRAQEFRGETIALQGLDGFFATRIGQTESVVYCVGSDRGRVACLVSHDNGETWQDYARSEVQFNIYAIGGCRLLSADGAIIGGFTDTSKTETSNPSPKVYFFRIDTNQ